MKRLVTILALALTACTTTPSGDGLTPQQAVYAAKGGYEAALAVAVAYRELPACDRTPQPCAKPEVVAQIQKAQRVARDALDAAEQAVRTPGFGEDVVVSAVSAGDAALKAFVSITATLKVK